MLVRYTFMNQKLYKIPISSWFSTLHPFKSIPLEKTRRSNISNSSLFDSYANWKGDKLDKSVRSDFSQLSSAYLLLSIQEKNMMQNKDLFFFLSTCCSFLVFPSHFTSLQKLIPFFTFHQTDLPQHLT